MLIRMLSKCLKTKYHLDEIFIEDYQNSNEPYSSNR